MNNDILTTLYENFRTAIPDDLQELLKSCRVRHEMITKYGKEAFLDSENLKFPVINPNTGQPDCRLIYAAYFRSTIFAKKGGSKQNSEEYYRKIQAAAMKLYEKQDCFKILKVQLEHEDVDLMTFTQIFEDHFIVSAELEQDLAEL